MTDDAGTAGVNQRMTLWFTRDVQIKGDTVFVPSPVGGADHPGSTLIDMWRYHLVADSLSSADFEAWLGRGAKPPPYVELYRVGTRKFVDSSMTILEQGIADGEVLVLMATDRVPGDDWFPTLQSVVDQHPFPAVMEPGVGPPGEPVTMEQVWQHQKALHAATQQGATMVTINTGGGVFLNQGQIGGFKNKMKDVSNAVSLAGEVNTDLKAALDELTDAVAEMVAQGADRISPAEAKRIGRYVEIIAEEAISEEPDKRWWSLSVDGLKEAAQNLADIGTPVLAAIANVAGLVQGMA